jgi:hypothetical protein
MTLPGFTAHTALGRSRRPYRPGAAGRSSVQTAGTIAPASLGCQGWVDAAQACFQGAVDSLSQGDTAGAQFHYAEYQTMMYYYDTCELMVSIGAGSA